MKVEFTDITPNNWRQLSSLRVKEEQKKFIASYQLILARAFVYREYNSEVKVICNEGISIGLLMQRDYEVDGKLSCILDQFMIADKYQGNGFGKAAMKLWISDIEKTKKYDSIILCYIDGDVAAHNLYKSLGFLNTGEVDDDEIVMEYYLNKKVD